MKDDDVRYLYSAARKPLLRDISASITSIIGHTLQLFAISVAICNCIFDEKLGRLYSLPRYRLEDVSSASGLTSGRNDLHLQPARLYVPLPPTPIEWDEQQRLLRAYWRLNVWRMLGNFSNMPSTDYPGLRGSELRSEAHNISLIDEMEDMAITLDEIGMREESLWTSPIPNPLYEPKTEPQSLQPRKLFSPGESPGHMMFTKTCARLHFSPMRGADWKVLRRLGFHIWSVRRLRRLRLRSTDYDARQAVPEGAAETREQQRQLSDEGEYVDMRDVLFTWSALYRTAVGESIRTSSAKNTFFMPAPES